jgi:hypothetical protein
MSVSLNAAATSELNVGSVPDILNQEWNREIFEKEFGRQQRCFTYNAETLGTVTEATKDTMEVDKLKLEAVVEKNGGNAPEGVDEQVLTDAGIESGAPRREVWLRLALGAVAASCLLL